MITLLNKPWRRFRNTIKSKDSFDIYEFYRRVKTIRVDSLKQVYQSLPTKIFNWSTSRANYSKY